MFLDEKYNEFEAYDQRHGIAEWKKRTKGYTFLQRLGNTRYSVFIKELDDDRVSIFLGKAEPYTDSLENHWTFEFCSTKKAEILDYIDEQIFLIEGAEAL